MADRGYKSGENNYKGDINDHVKLKTKGISADDLSDFRIEDVEDDDETPQREAARPSTVQQERSPQSTPQPGRLSQQRPAQPLPQTQTAPVRPRSPQLFSIDDIIDAFDQIHPVERAALGYRLTGVDAIRKLSVDHIIDYLQRCNISKAALEVIKIWLEIKKDEQKRQ